MKVANLIPPFSAFVANVWIVGIAPLKLLALPLLVLPWNLPRPLLLTLLLLRLLVPVLIVPVAPDAPFVVSLPVLVSPAAGVVAPATFVLMLVNGLYVLISPYYLSFCSLLLSLLS